MKIWVPSQAVAINLKPQCHQPKLPCRFKTFLPQTSTETSMAPAFFFATTKIQENIHYKGALHIAQLT